MSSKTIIILLIFIVIYFQCASRGRPGGGPVDKIPPEIIFTYPTADSTNINELERVEVHFSERMDEASVTNSIFISPPLKYKTEWSGGDELEIEIEDTLLYDRTYVITIGSGAKDSRNNRLKDSFQFAFSTGGHIDRGKIVGKVYNISSKNLLYVYAYNFAENDTLNPTQQKANFLSQPGEDGSFKLDYLSLGMYRVFVVEDLNKNLLLDADYERVGIPPRDVELDSSSVIFEPLYFQITKIDTISPFVSGARALNTNKIIMRLSEQINKITEKNICIIDTLSLDTLMILGIIQNKDEGNQYIIFTSQQDSAKGYKIISKDLSDTTGNLQLDAQIVNFVGIAEKDTNKFKILNILPGDSLNNLDLSTTINIKFSLPIDTVSVLNSFSCWESGKDISSGQWSWPNLSDCIFKPNPSFLPGRQYFFKIKTGYIHSLWSDTLTDTTITRTFFMKSEDEYGSLSGSIIGFSDTSYNYILDIYQIAGREKFEKIKVSEKNTFKVNWLPDGEYQLGGFIDIDGDSKYSFGGLFPFQYSEPFYFSEDTIRIRKRWETSEVQFSIPGVE